MSTASLVARFSAAYDRRDVLCARLAELRALAPGQHDYEIIRAEYSALSDKQQHKKVKSDVKELVRSFSLRCAGDARDSRLPLLPVQVRIASESIDELTDDIDALHTNLIDAHVDVGALVSDKLRAQSEPEWKLRADAALNLRDPPKRTNDGMLKSSGAAAHASRYLEPPKDEVETNVDVLDESPTYGLDGKEIVEHVDSGRRFHDSGKVEAFESGAIRVMGARVPPSLALLAKTHQKEGIEFALGNLVQGEGCVLAHSMGLGKTFSALALADAIHRLNSPLHALLLSPKSVRVSWDDELTRWAAHLTVSLHTVKDSGMAAAMVRTWKLVGGLLSMTYELFQSLHASGATADWIDTIGLVVMDEAHLLKNRKTLIYQAVDAIPCKSRIALTGTPIANHLSEYFTILKLVAPAKLEEHNIASPELFRRRFITPIQLGQTKDATDATAKAMRQHIHVLRQQMDSVMHRKTMALLVHSLPLKTEYVVRHAVSAQVKAQLTATASSGCFEQYEALLTACMNEKLSVVNSLLDAISQTGERTLVFSQRREPLKQLLARGDGAVYNGELSDASRTQLVHAFQSGVHKNLYMTTQCGSLGLNLTQATRVIIMDCMWNPSYNIQAVCRAWRYGQTKEVVVYRLVATDTIEDYCYRLQIVKTTLAANILEEREINRQFTRAELKHNADSLTITPLATIPDPVLASVAHPLALVVTSHDGAFHEDDDMLTETEKRDAQNDVFRSRNSVERVMNFGDSVYSVKPGEVYFAEHSLEDGSDSIKTVATVADATGLYPPYIPIISNKTASSLVLLTGPMVQAWRGWVPRLEVRMRRVNDDETIVWEHPVFQAVPAQLDDGKGVIYSPVTVHLDTISARPVVCVFCARLVIGSLLSDWSEPSAACMV